MLCQISVVTKRPPLSDSGTTHIHKSIYIVQMEMERANKNFSYRCTPTIIWLKRGLRIIFMLKGRSHIHKTVHEILQKNVQNFDLIKRHFWRHLSTFCCTVHTAWKAVSSHKKCCKLHQNQPINGDRALRVSTLQSSVQAQVQEGQRERQTKNIQLFHLRPWLWITTLQADRDCPYHLAPLQTFSDPTSSFRTKGRREFRVFAPDGKSAQTL